MIHLYSHFHFQIFSLENWNGSIKCDFLITFSFIMIALVTTERQQNFNLIMLVIFIL